MNEECKCYLYLTGLELCSHCKILENTIKTAVKAVEDFRGRQKPKPKPMTIKKAVKYLRKYPDMQLIRFEYTAKGPMELLPDDVHVIIGNETKDYNVGVGSLGWPVYVTRSTNYCEIKLIKENS